jgi:hypothetical protein
LGSGVLGAFGAFVFFVAVLVYFTQGSQIEVTARVSDETCHQQTDYGDGSRETRCDMDATYTTVDGRTHRARITDAFASEIRHSGSVATIQLRYDRSDPRDPYKQSNLMSLPAFVIMAGLGLLLMLPAIGGLVVWMRARRAAAKRPRVPSPPRPDLWTWPS